MEEDYVPIIDTWRAMEDLVKDGIDVAIRGHMDTLPDSSMIQTRLATSAAAPAARGIG